MRRLTPLLAILVLAGCGGGAHATGLSIRVDRHPFRLTVLEDGKVVSRQNLDGRLRYQLANGKQYELTSVTSSHGDAYDVATSEPGRSATVVVKRDAHGVHLSMELHPAANVQEVYDAFDASTKDHFL